MVGLFLYKDKDVFKVHSYLSIAGVQRSTSACGVNCGQNCGGAYMNDINKFVHYEGQNVYVLQSTADTTITKDRCGHYIGELAGSNRTVTVGFLMFGYKSPILAQQLGPC
jgi:hypothetical protein